MEPLDALIDAFNPDAGWLSANRAAYGRLFRDEPLDSILMAGGAGAPKEFAQTRFNMKQQFESPGCMLYEGLKGMVSAAAAQGASMPTIRANLGVGFVPSVFGVEQLIFEDKMPWPQGHPPKERLQEMQPSDLEDVSDMGLVPRAREIYEFYRDKLGTTEFCFVADTQGVMDIAHLVRGDDLFYDLYDDPAFVHHVMELCLQAYISVTKSLKAMIGEPLDSGLHGGMAMDNGGVRYCMDTSLLLSREQLEEFEVPYLRRALQAFGGGWVHFCGYAPHVTDVLVNVPEVRGINPNYMDSRPYDYGSDVKKIRGAGKFFTGAPFKSPDESTRDYFRRVLEPLGERRGMHFTPRGQALEPGDYAGRRALLDEVERELFG